VIFPHDYASELRRAKMMLAVALMTAM